MTDLTQGSYTFSTEKGVSEGRFEIVYETGTVLNTGETGGEKIEVYREGEHFTVTAVQQNITKIQVYDMSGRLVFTVKSNSKKVLVPAEVMVNGTYVFTISQSGKVTTRKVIK